MTGAVVALYLLLVAFTAWQVYSGSGPGPEAHG
jgi:hypothetical protein